MRGPRSGRGNANSRRRFVLPGSGAPIPEEAFPNGVPLAARTARQLYPDELIWAPQSARFFKEQTSSAPLPERSAASPSPDFPMVERVALQNFSAETPEPRGELRNGKQLLRELNFCFAVRRRWTFQELRLGASMLGSFGMSRPHSGFRISFAAVRVSASRKRARHPAKLRSGGLRTEFGNAPPGS